MLPKGRIPSLDGFRAISILLVIFGHLVINNLLPAPLHVVLREVGFGELGVRVFFVISGFLITYLLLAERARYGKVDLKAFYIRRVLRIFPVFYVYLLVLAVLNATLSLKVPALNFVSAALYVENFSPWGSVWLLGHSWSLAVEEQFYLVWPAIFGRLQKLGRISVWVGAIMAGSAFRALHYKFPVLSKFILAPFLMHADFLFSGCFIAFLAFYQYDRVIAFVRSARSLWVYATLALVWFFTRCEANSVYDRFFVPVSGAVVNAGVSFLLVYFVFKAGTVGYRFLNLGFIGYIGRLSYSLYVWQQLFLSRTGFWWTKFPQDLLLTGIAAYLSFRLVETPFLRLKDHFKVTTRTPVPAPAPAPVS